MIVVRLCKSQDQAELVHIETSLGEICPTRFMVHRVDDPHISIATVVESCKAASPHLILLGSSEVFLPLCQIRNRAEFRQFILMIIIHVPMYIYRPRLLLQPKVFVKREPQ